MDALPMLTRRTIMMFCIRRSGCKTHAQHCTCSILINTSLVCCYEANTTQTRSTKHTSRALCWLCGGSAAIPPGTQQPTPAAPAAPFERSPPPQSPPSPTPNPRLVATGRIPTLPSRPNCGYKHRPRLRRQRRLLLLRLRHLLVVHGASSPPHRHKDIRRVRQPPLSATTRPRSLPLPLPRCGRSASASTPPQAP